MVKEKVTIGLGSGHIPLTVSVGDGDVPARGCLCPILTGNLEYVQYEKAELNNVEAHRRESRFGRKRNVHGARDLRMDIGAHPGSPAQPC